MSSGNRDGCGSRTERPSLFGCPTSPGKAQPRRLRHYPIRNNAINHSQRHHCDNPAIPSRSRRIARMDPLDEHYPQSCPFCKISTAYAFNPGSSPVPHNPDPDLVSPQCHLILSSPHVLAFLDIMPMAPGHILVTTRRHYTKLTDLLHQSPDSAATDAEADGLETARALGEWLPRVSAALCQVTGIDDWNVVQNNGARAAQVVPHVHFHLIPRYQELQLDGSSSSGGGGKSRNGAGAAPAGLARSWKMFGRGTREDLDDEEGAAMAARLREALRDVLGENGKRAKL